jgi:tetratricopeptide (TPR) repeat protein
MPWRLEPQSDLVVQLHLQPSGKPEKIQVSVGFFLTDQPPVRQPFGLRLGSETIDIPAGDANYAIDDRYVLPVDCDVLAVQPHAHNLGHEMTARATLPDASVQPLITIRDWDFRWQDVYRYRTPIRLPRGTTISMRFTYDNSASNPRNPFQPPHHIVWGQNTTDEMGDLWLQLVPVHDEDGAQLGADIGKKTRAEDIAAYTRVLEGDPSNPLRHDAVAMLYLQDGRPQEAIPHFRESLRLNSDSAPTHYNYGLALSMLRQYGDAVREFETTVRLDPSHAEGHNNLGAMLHVTGQFDRAAAEYRKAIELRPDNAEAHANLGRLLLLQGKGGEAVVAFDRALALRPDVVTALTGLSWIRATSTDPALRRPGQAVTLADRARQLTGGDDPLAFDSMAAGYAALGEFDAAVRAVELGIGVAERRGMSALAADMRNRLTLYQQRKAFVG